MKTLPIISSKISRVPIVPLLRKQKYLTGVDVFAREAKDIFPLTYIKLKTVEDLYAANFVPSNQNCGDKIFSTFVLDKLTGNPVEVNVLVNAVNNFFEEYCILDKKSNQILGKKYFKIVSEDNVIEPGYMESSAKNLSGIGIRLHQIAVERMLMKGMDNIEIISLPKSYKFHLKMGFAPFHSILILDSEYFEKVVSNYSKNFNIDREDVKKMMVAQPSSSNSDKIELDKYISYENILKYLYSQTDKSPLNSCHLSIRMRLTDGAIDEWKKLININPIIIDKNFPKGHWG